MPRIRRFPTARDARRDDRRHHPQQLPVPHRRPNLFKQVPSWKVYVGGMNGPCSTPPNPNYDPRTNAPTWVGVPQAICRRQDVPMGSLSSGALTRDLNAGKLPRFSMLVPGLCQSMTFVQVVSGGPPEISTFVALGDQWLGQRLDQIVASPRIQVRIDRGVRHLAVRVAARTTSIASHVLGIRPAASR